MIRSIGYLTTFLLAASPLWASELDAEYGAKPPGKNPAVAVASATTDPGSLDLAKLDVGKGSELDAERLAQSWRRFGGFGYRGFGFGHRGFGFGGFGRRGFGFGFGGFGYRNFGYGGFGRGLGFGLGLGYGLGYGGYGLGYGGYGLGYGGYGLGYSPVTFYSTSYLGLGGGFGYRGYGGYGLGCW